MYVVYKESALAWMLTDTYRAMIFCMHCTMAKCFVSAILQMTKGPDEHLILISTEYKHLKIVTDTKRP